MPEFAVSNESDIIEKVRMQFPLLNRRIAGRDIIYFDNAATTLKPKPVIEAVTNFYTYSTANIHRGAHILSAESSHAFEDAREKVAQYLNVEPKTVVFTNNSTDSIHLVATGLGINKSYRILSTVLEHHSNILPWMDADCRFSPLDSDGCIDLDRMAQIAQKWKPDLICVSHASNVTGEVINVKEIAEIAHRHDARLLVDAAQSVPHMRICPHDLNCDYMVFSAHKMMGPSGVGVLWGTVEALESLGTPRRGGGMVNKVVCDEFEPKELPWRLEAGTPNIEGVIGFGAAVAYLSQIPQQWMEKHLGALAKRLVQIILRTEGIKLIGSGIDQTRLSLATFALQTDRITADQFAKILSDTFGIMIRSGSFCAHPLFSSLGFSEGIRSSLYLYNTVEELDYLEHVLKKLSDVFL